MLENIEFSAPPLNYEAWKTLARQNCGAETRVSDPSSFGGWAHLRSLFGFAAMLFKLEYASDIVDSGIGTYQAVRTARDVRLSGPDYFQAILPAGGQSMLIQNDQIAKLAAGDIAIADMARPVNFLAQKGLGQWVSVVLPRRELVSHLGMEPQGGAFRRGDNLATRALYRLLQDAIEDDETPSPTVCCYMRLAVYDLIGAIFAPSETASFRTDKLFTRISRLITARFAEPDLSPSLVAAEIGISVRYLQKLFTARGTTCSHFITSLRLDHASRLLQRRSEFNNDAPLAEIAYACGFLDYALFSRKFRKRFGHPPSAHVTATVRKETTEMTLSV
jgi:AraC family transcriptional regulator, positive regulator of tynA and feaB